LVLAALFLVPNVSYAAQKKPAAKEETVPVEILEEMEDSVAGWLDIEGLLGRSYSLRPVMKGAEEAAILTLESEYGAKLTVTLNPVNKSPNKHSGKKVFAVARCQKDDIIIVGKLDAIILSPILMDIKDLLEVYTYPFFKLRVETTKKLRVKNLQIRPEYWNFTKRRQKRYASSAAALKPGSFLGCEVKIDKSNIWATADVANLHPIYNGPRKDLLRAFQDNNISSLMVTPYMEKIWNKFTIMPVSRYGTPKKHSIKVYSGFRGTE